MWVIMRKDNREEWVTRWRVMSQGRYQCWIMNESKDGANDGLIDELYGRLDDVLIKTDKK